MQGYVLGTTDGEHLFQSSGEIVIKVDPTQVRTIYRSEPN